MSAGDGTAWSEPYPGNEGAGKTERLGEPLGYEPLEYAEPLPPKGIRILCGTEVDQSVQDQAKVFLHALLIYQDRNVVYKDNWRRYGWRGCLYDLRRKVERAWDALWDSPAHAANDRDDLLDVINYAAIAARAVREQNRDGTGGWWNS